MKALISFKGEGLADGAEHLDQNNILPLGNPWYWDPVQLNGTESYRRQRLLDTLEFLYELQCGFYDRYVAAVREAGYAGEILIVALARARNRGQQLNDTQDEIIAVGTPPILLEPVHARIRFHRSGLRRVLLLDHDGRPTERTLPVRAGGVEIDGARDRTPFYLADFE